jgi:hypothetical protein
MSGGYGQTGLEILSYFLMENGWVSSNTVFNADTLSEISLPRP